MERYQVVGHLRLDPNGTVTSYADAQAQLEAVRREREEYKGDWQVMQGFLKEFQCTPSMMASKVDILQAALDVERAELTKVRATCDMLGRERNEADEAKYSAERQLDAERTRREQVEMANYAKDGQIETLQAQLTQLKAPANPAMLSCGHSSGMIVGHCLSCGELHIEPKGGDGE